MQTLLRFSTALGITLVAVALGFGLMRGEADAAVAAPLFSGGAAFLLAAGLHDVRRGAFTRGPGAVRRDENPVAFWFVVSLADFGAALAALVVAVFFALRL